VARSPSRPEPEGRHHRRRRPQLARVELATSPVRSRASRSSSSTHSIDIDLNQANGAFTKPTAPSRPASSTGRDLDLNRDGTFADTLSIGGKAIDYADELIHAQGDITTLNVADLVSGSAHFDLTRKLIKVNQGGSFDATLLTFALSSLHLALGTETFGIAITGGSVAIAAITPALSTDARRWVGVVGRDLGASLNLAGFVTATLDNVNLQLNNFSGGATVLDWTHNLDLNNDTTFGGPAVAGRERSADRLWAAI
jgi:hypothetical protein